MLQDAATIYMIHMKLLIYSRQEEQQQYDGMESPPIKLEQFSSTYTQMTFFRCYRPFIFINSPLSSLLFPPHNSNKKKKRQNTHPLVLHLSDWSKYRCEYVQTKAL